MAADVVWCRGERAPFHDFVEITTSAAHRLVARRNIDTGELGYFWAHTPAGASLADLVRVIGMRWMVEECFQAAKGQVGLDHYQVRSWSAWYRHVTLAIATHSWLTVTAVLAARQGGHRNPPRPPAHQPTQ